MGDRKIHILLDSGSSHSFLSTAVAAQLPGVTDLHKSVSVQFADGTFLHCSSEIVAAEWSVQGYSVHYHLKVLPIGAFDLIVGMDWLEAFSPMKIHWRQKWLSFPYGQSTAVLYGDTASPTCQVMQLSQVSATEGSSEGGDSRPIHPLVQPLLEQFADLFEEPTSLPPRRACDHRIPLLPGAQPVAQRQYRYSPALKSKIEKQVTDMLQFRLIQPSTSAFSSPVLLVCKKDCNWRFCVDYRLLNSLTVKSKFPIPVIDELLDELAEAKWFSTLDLRAGFNQIRLAPGEEHKTAFQTHWGQFEFTVMSFGLTGAPNTFQGAMNITLRPLLRHCVLVFFDDILVYSRTLTEHLEHL